jgi:hypothetical protein
LVRLFRDWFLKTDHDGAIRDALTKWPAAEPALRTLSVWQTHVARIGCAAIRNRRHY